MTNEVQWYPIEEYGKVVPEGTAVLTDQGVGLFGEFPSREEGKVDKDWYHTDILGSLLWTHDGEYRAYFEDDPTIFCELPELPTGFTKKMPEQFG